MLDFTPTPPNYPVDWEAISSKFEWIRAMQGIQQNPLWHKEGDVYIHTKMVAEAMSMMPQCAKSVLILAT